MDVRTHFSRALLATTFLAMPFGLGACTPSSGDPSPQPMSARPTLAPTRTPTPTVDPAVEEAEAAILEAYRGYWAAKVVSFADPAVEQDPNLARYSDDTALTDAQATIATLRSNGIKIPGEPTLTPVVSDIQLGESSTAKITDCVDVANWQPIVAATGDSATVPDQPLRVPTDSTAFVIDGHWSIRTSVAYRDTTC